MLNVKITNRMSHEDYVAASTDYPYVLSRRHMWGICSTFIVCMVMILPTPDMWFEDTSNQIPTLTQASRDYLAADESATEKALAAAENDIIPHQENYDDYDIPLDQFAQTPETTDESTSADSGALESEDSELSTGESELATEDYHQSVTDSAIANNGDWGWETNGDGQNSLDSTLADASSSSASDGSGIGSDSGSGSGTNSTGTGAGTGSTANTAASTRPGSSNTQANAMLAENAGSTEHGVSGTAGSENSAISGSTGISDSTGKTSSTDSKSATLANNDKGTKGTGAAGGTGSTSSSSSTGTPAGAPQNDTSNQGALAQNAKTQSQSQTQAQTEGKGAGSGTLSDTSTGTGDKSKDKLVAKLPRPDGKWYHYTVESGDNFSVIFRNLNLPYATLNRITKVAKRKDLSLDVGDPIYFLVDKDNIVKEIVNTLDDGQQVRFTRMSGEDDFVVVYEALNAQVKDANLLAKAPDAFEMPLAKKALAERKQQQEAREKALAERQARDKANNVNPNRPRLLIGQIQKGENFARAARREGLTPSEIKSVTQLFKNKMNVNRMKTGDSFRVLFTGIGTQSSMCAISINSSQGNFEIFMNPKDRNFYGENEYTPTAGIFRRFPLAGEIKVTSHFNPQRRHPVTHRISPHNGVDFKANIGTPVYAPADGVVTFSGYQRAAGYYVIVRHANNYSTVYMHLSKSEVKKGEKVIVGQVIARSGNTGRTTGPHLHYEIRIDDRPVNPLKVELPSSSHPNLAREQREAFANNVKILRADLKNDRLAAAQPAKKPQE